VGGETVAGLVSADRLNEVAGEWEDHLARWAQGEPDLELTGRSWQLEQGDVLVPASEQARGLFCVGMNYRAHRDEVDASLGQYEKGWAVIFSKMSESLAAAGQVLELTAALSSEFDWEVELGVVIGQGGRRISGDRAFDDSRDPGLDRGHFCPRGTPGRRHHRHRLARRGRLYASSA